MPGPLGCDDAMRMVLPMGQEQDLAPLSAMACEEVESDAGERLGFIKDFMVDGRDGRIAYVILSCGGWFGIGARLVAVPWGLVERNGHRYVLHVDKEILQHIPGVDRNGTVRALDAIWARHADGKPEQQAGT